MDSKIKKVGIIRVFTRTKHIITDRDYRFSELKSLSKPTIWTSRMLDALSNGVKRGKWYSLFDKLCREEVLNDACTRVLAKKGKHGVDMISCDRYNANRTSYNQTLLEGLSTGKYVPRQVLRVEITKLGSKEKRPLGIPTIRDRIVQTALKDLIEPIFDVDFSDNSFGFRPSRGAKDALREVAHNLEDGYHFIVDADIKSYFDTINHNKLMKQIKEKICDGRVLDLIEQFLNQGILEGLKEWVPEEGTPQGGVISPLLANIYLNPLDYLMEEKQLRMVRYADDFVVMCKSQEEAEQALEMIRLWMNEAELVLHPEKTRIADLAVADGYFEFLGYHFKRLKRGHISRWPRKSSMKKCKATIKSKTRKCHRDSMEVIIADLMVSLKGWYGYFRHSNEYTFSGVDGYVRRRLRSILRKRRRMKGISRGSVEDHKRWSNSLFKLWGYESLLEAHLAEIKSLRRNC